MWTAAFTMLQVSSKYDQWLVYVPVSVCNISLNAGRVIRLQGRYSQEFLCMRFTFTLPSDEKHVFVM